MKPGVHDLNASAYYADEIAQEPSLNASVLKVLLGQSPRHAWCAHPRLNPAYAEKVSDRFDVGTAAHEVWLLHNDDRVHVLDPSVRDWRSKAAQEVRDRARAEGLIPMLDARWRQVSEMLQAVRSQIAEIDTGAEPELFAAGLPEQTLVWRDRGGVLCRARLDWLHDTHECVDDLKTAPSANPEKWARSTFFAIGADIQAAFTLRGLRAAFGVESTFRFLLAETSAPYAVSAVRPSVQALDFANRRIDVGLDRWKRCLAEDRWPAFPDRVLDIDPPPWAEMQWAETEQLHQELEQTELAA